MEVGKHCSTKARAAEVEQEEGDAMEHGGEGGSAVVAMEDTTKPQIDVKMDVAVFLCQACLLPLKPPIFKCDAAGHILCSYCRGGHGDICSRADTHCGELDAFVAAAKVPCPYREFGCERYVVFHGAAEHRRACPCAPCSCPDPGCPFVGAPPALLDHLAAAHARPIIAVRYDRSWNLHLSLSQVWHVLVGQEDRSVFLVCLGALGAATTTVSLVHVTADGAAGPKFWCKLSVERQGDGKDKRVLMASTVSTSTLTGGAPAPGQGMFLAVPKELLSGDMLALRIRIDQL
ncbi:unnamed protein product [Alopecurus aequalis]